MASNLLILDEFGYQSLDRQESNLLFRVVNYRYQRGSIALTTNKGITSWPEVLAGDEVLAGAILDRLLHSATVLNIQGRSYRLQDMAAGREIRSMSFTETNQLLAADWLLCGCTGVSEVTAKSAQAQSVCAVIGNRPGRSEPRENKRRPKVLKLMTRTRDLFKAALAGISKSP